MDATGIKTHESEKGKSGAVKIKSGCVVSFLGGERAGMCAAETNTKTPKQHPQTKDKAMASDSDLV